MFVRHLLNLEPFYDTPDAGGGGGSDESVGELEQDLSELGDAETPPEEEEEEDEEGEEAEGEEEEPEVEGEEEEEEEGEEEAGEEEEEEEGEGKGKKLAVADETDEQGRPTVKALKAAFPDIFKKYPYLRTMFFEYPKLAEVFPDAETAAAAAQKASEYDQLEAALVNAGDPKLLIETLGENNPRALAKIVERFPEVIRAQDPNLYRKMATGFVEELLYLADAHAKKIGADKDQPGRNLYLAARHIANYVFANGGEIPDISKRTPASKQEEPTEAERQLEEERTAYAAEKYQGAMQDVYNRAVPELDKVLGAKLGELTPFERKAVMKDARREVDQKLLSDVAFQRRIRGLWNRAAQDGYSEASKTNIRRAWLERARAVAIGIRNRLRQEALDARTPGKSNANVPGKKRQFTQQGGRSTRGAQRVVDPKKINWRKTSDMDILNS